jgi:hypothetical protein
MNKKNNGFFVKKMPPQVIAGANVYNCLNLQGLHAFYFFFMLLHLGL